MLNNNKTYLSHIRENFYLAYPVMLSQLGHVMMGVVDSVMVGHVNATSLAAASLSNVAFNVLLLFGIGVSYAITPLVAEAHGENDHDRIVNTLRHGLVINFITSMVLIVCVYYGKNILFHIDQSPQVVNLAIPYLKITTWSLVPILIFQSLKQFAEGLSLTRIAMIVVITSNVVNIILNYFLIFGHGGFPALGLEGAAWATFTSRIFMATFMVCYVIYGKEFSSFKGLFVFGKYSGALFKKLLHIGIPAGIQFIFEVAAFDFSAVMMGWISAQTLAAHQIAINMATVSYMITSGLGAAATIRVGFYLGQKDFINARQASYTLLYMALAIMSLWGIVFIAGKHFLPGLYVNDPQVIEIATPLLIIAGLFQLADGTQVVCTAALRGLQDVKIPSLFIFSAYWIIGIPLGYWLGFRSGYGAVGIWLGLLIGLTLTALAMFTRFRYKLNQLGEAASQNLS